MTIKKQLEALPEGVHAMTIKKGSHFDTLLIECSDSEGFRMYHAFNDTIPYCKVVTGLNMFIISTSLGLNHFQGLNHKLVPSNFITITQLPTVRNMTIHECNERIKNKK